MPGKSHFPQSGPPIAPGPQETLPEGGSVSACSAGFLTVEPVCGQTGCDHSEALEDSPHHSPESRAKPAVVVELREAMRKEKKEEEHLEIWGWCFTHLRDLG